MPVPPVDLRPRRRRQGDLRSGRAAAAAAADHRGRRGLPGRHGATSTSPSARASGSADERHDARSGQRCARRAPRQLGRRARRRPPRLVKGVSLRKIFPDHWSFMLGEIALYCFVILLLTGVFLTLCASSPAMGEVVYDGSYAPLQGIEMSRGLRLDAATSPSTSAAACCMRQIHHWAALLFVAAIMRAHAPGVLHRRVPQAARDQLGDRRRCCCCSASLEGFTGYSLPDDLLSGTGLRIADGIIQAIPVVGTYLSFFALRRRVPRRATSSRGCTRVHILLMPGDPPGADRRAPAAGRATTSTPSSPARAAPNENVVGYPLLPGLHGQGRRLLLHRLRRHRADRRPVHDQPDLGVRPLRPLPGLRRLPARLVHGLRSTARCA